MGETSSHQISVCTSCKQKGSSHKLGFDLIEKLQVAFNKAGDAVPVDYKISGVACMAGCDHACTVAFHASGKTSYLFGDLYSETDIQDLVEFARQYAYLGDGWCSSVDRPGKLRKSTLARIPTHFPCLENTVEQSQ